MPRNGLDAILSAVASQSDHCPSYPPRSTIPRGCFFTGRRSGHSLDSPNGPRLRGAWPDSSASRRAIPSNGATDASAVRRALQADCRSDCPFRGSLRAGIAPLLRCRVQGIDQPLDGHGWTASRSTGDDYGGSSGEDDGVGDSSFVKLALRSIVITLFCDRLLLHFFQ